MKTAEPIDLSPTIWYRRQLEGADVSLEANTRAVPTEGRFYVLREGDVVFSSVAFDEALSHYHEICHEYWEEHLEADAPDERMAAAWGLIGLNPQHDNAGDLIRSEGPPEAHKRLESMRRRAAAVRRQRAMQARRSRQAAAK